MTHEQWQRVEALFEAALARSEADRAAFLDGACHSDPSLRSEVESLLAAAAKTGDGLLDTREGLANAGNVGRLASLTDSSVEPTGALVGTRLGRFEIVSLLGVGGMGEVYLAKETTLGRDVAVKVLPASLVADPERRARFTREARTLAAFSQPHIASIHGLEEMDGRQMLVMEYVPGETLEDRLGAGPLSVSDALVIAKQIAEALDDAHEKGIVHRDLKPANIKLKDTRGGQPKAANGRASAGLDLAHRTVKVLDFGLAKATTGDTAGPDLTAGPTMTDLTRAGTIVGTPRYMSPEQARGQVVDKRTDIWAFGCVLFEMLAGRPAMPGKTLADTIAAVLEREPDWNALPATLPPDVRRLLTRCLEKNPMRRLRDIGEARVELDSALAPRAHHMAPAPTAPSAVVAGAHPRQRWLRFVGVGVLAVAAFGVWAKWGRPAPPTTPGALDLTLPAPFGNVIDSRGGLAVSPDGTRVAFYAGSRLWVRALAEAEPREIAVTPANPSSHAFWSPDGRALAYPSPNGLSVVGLDGTAPVSVLDFAVNGGTFIDNETILYGQGTGPLQKTSLTNRAGVPVTALAEGDTAHRWPFMLPDHDHFLYLAVRQQGYELRVGSLQSPSTTVSLGASQSNATYAAGHLLFLQGGTLVAQPFDVQTFKRAGPPLTLVNTVALNAWGLAGFSSSDAGVLATERSENPFKRLTWLTRDGAPTVISDVGSFFNLALSPDERSVAVSRAAGAPSNYDIWIYDLERPGATRRLTTDRGMEFDPFWSPDGRTIVFISNRTGRFEVMSRAADGEGDDRVLVPAPTGGISQPTYTPDGRELLVTSGGEIRVASVDAPSAHRSLMATPTRTNSASISADGRWVMFASAESGRSEVFARRYPDGGGLVQVSVDGGTRAQWRGDGREAFFLSLDFKMMAVDIAEKDGVLKPGVPHALFQTKLGTGNGRPYAVTKDGQRFLVPVDEPTAPDPAISLLVNWPERLKQ